MRLYLIILVCFVFVGLVSAQEDELTPYEIALERIAEAEASGATVLQLSRLNLTNLPPEIGNLENLQGLNLSYNQLETLPAEIGNLQNLQRLDLIYNQLETLPAEIGNLQNLRELILFSNQLTSLPSEIGNLQNLRGLYLAYNALNSLPPQIGQLASLCSLEISYNQLRVLPQELAQLSTIDTGSDCSSGFQLYLDYGSNPLISPPDEVLAQGTEAILAYLRNQAWWHLQRMIISIAASGIGLLVIAILGLRWRNRLGKRKRKHDGL